MYHFLNSRGYDSPYVDEARALRLLEKAGIAIPASYRRTLAPATLPAPTEKKLSLTSPHKPGDLGPLDKLRATIAKRLPWRLAKLLPEGQTPKGLARTKAILRKGGYEGPRWDNEDRALAIFKAQGISIEGFEYLRGNGEPVPNRSPPAPQHLQIVPRPSPPIAIANREDTRRLQRVITLLSMFEEQIFAQIRNGAIDKLRSPLELPIAALNELREALKAN